MTDKHTSNQGRERLLRSVPEPPETATADELVGLPAQLGERVDGYVVRFAAQLRQGVLAASVAIGLQVDELRPPSAHHRTHPILQQDGVSILIRRVASQGPAGGQSGPPLRIRLQRLALRRRAPVATSRDPAGPGC